MQLQVVPWTWRDGSVHLEMRLATFHTDDVMFTHLDSGGGGFTTACGLPYWGVTCSYGLGQTQRINCPECRKLLASLTFNIEVRDPVVAT